MMFNLLYLININNSLKKGIDRGESLSKFKLFHKCQVKVKN